jgi:YD repeat-containing protein
MKAQYQYHQDSSPKYAHDLLDERLDRAFSYDNAGSLKEAYSGSEARDYVNGTNSGTATGPYRQSYQHDAFGNMTNRTNRFWSQTDIFTASYANNRRQNQAFQYDAVGNLTQDTDLQYAYDAAGLNTSVVSAAANKTIAPLYDGDGQAVRRVETESGTTSITYYLRSSVLGNVISELNAQGVKLKTYVYLGSQVLARQESNWIVWQHSNPITGSRGISNRDGGYGLEAEPDPMGIDVGFFDPFVHLELYEPPPEGITGLLAGSGVPNGRCVLDGMAIDCGWAMR